MRHSLLAICGAGLLLAVPGCGGSEGNFHQVEGSVTWDGVPLPTGDIVFFPEEKEFGPDAGKIKDGKYNVKVREGKKRVEIRAVRPVPGKKGPMGEDAIEDYIPEEYNAKTTLTAEVAKGKTHFDFPLTTKQESIGD